MTTKEKIIATLYTGVIFFTPESEAEKEFFETFSKEAGFEVKDYETLRRVWNLEFWQKRYEDKFKKMVEK